MTARATLPRVLLDGPFRVRTALHRGISAGRLRAADLVAPFHGTRWTRHPRDHREAARALAPRLRTDQAFSHTTAAALVGVPLPARLERDRRLHVTTIGKDQALRVRGAVGHRSRAGSVTLARTQGVAIVGPADTFVMLATMLSVDELVIVGDALVGWLRWCTVRELAAAVRRHRGRRGIRRARAALAEIRPGSRSPGETRLRLLLKRHGLPEPSLNLDVEVDGRWIACVDLAYPEARLAIEYESDLHRTDEATFRKDLTRGELLRDAGWWLVRATRDDVGRDPTRVRHFVERVRKLLGTAGASWFDIRQTDGVTSPR